MVSNVIFGFHNISQTVPINTLIFVVEKHLTHQSLLSSPLTLVEGYSSLDAKSIVKLLQRKGMKHANFPSPTFPIVFLCERFPSFLALQGRPILL